MRKAENAPLGFKVRSEFGNFSVPDLYASVATDVAGMLRCDCEETVGSKIFDRVCRVSK
jgi:hypothetical protein